MTFDNQNANPTPAQNLTLNASAPEYQSTYWTDNNMCGGTTNNTIAVNVAAAIHTTTYTKDMFFNDPGVNGNNAWIKLNNLAFSGNATLDNPIPLSIGAYDSEDTTGRYFIIGGTGVAGVASASTVNLGTAQASTNNWSISGYTRTVGFTPSAFFDYVKSRKDYTTVDASSFDMSTLSAGISYVDGDVTISTDPTNDVVLIVNGKVNITKDFNKKDVTTANKSVAILANNITVGDDVAYAFGIFATSGTFDTGTNTSLGLKIKGNLSASQETPNPHFAFPSICARIALVEFIMFAHPGFVFAMDMPSGAP